MQLREHLGHLAAQHGPTNGLTGGISPPLPSFLQGPILYGLGLIGAGRQAWKEEARF